MIVLNARNVHQALPEALYQLNLIGVRNESRNGPVLKFNEPVVTVYERPCERVMFWPQRDCNPFFHLFESLWMLGGRRDVESVAHYVARMRSFSDDGTTLHGAYGHRWRLHFGFDQLPKIIDALRKDPTDRRQVLSMWDAASDLGRSGKDLPCNLQALFTVNNDGALDMLVTNRSNDIVWGAYGANAVHFSYLLEHVASSLGRPVGRYWQMSMNFHSYLDTLKGVEDLQAYAEDDMLPASARWAGLDPYQDAVVQPFPLMSTDPADWGWELENFLDDDGPGTYADPFFSGVAQPMRAAHQEFKGSTGASRYVAALAALEDVQASDWKLAAQQWVQRRQEKFLRANDDGVLHE